MGKIRRRGPNVEPAVLSFVRRLAREPDKHGIAQMHAAALKEFPDAVLTVKQVSAIASDARYFDGSGMWRLGDDAVEPEDAALLLSVLATGSITRQEARWIIRVRRAVPDVPIRAVAHIARTYLSFEQNGQDSGALDYMLALAPWRQSDRSDESWHGKLFPAAAFGGEGLEALYLGRFICTLYDAEHAKEAPDATQA